MYGIKFAEMISLEIPGNTKSILISKKDNVEPIRFYFQSRRKDIL